MSRSTPHGVVLAAGCVAFGFYALHVGQDDSYDLRYYHYWVAYALLGHRLGFDYAPAQIQSFFNPFSFLPFYWLANHVTPTVAGFLLGAWQGLTFGLTFALSHELFRAGGTAVVTATGLSLLCAALGTVAPVFLSAVGGSANDVPIAQLVLLSLFLVLRWWRLREPGRERASRMLVGSAIVLGMAAGLKPVAGVYAVAALAGLVVLPVRRSTRWRLAVTYGVMLTLGFLVTNGYWLTVLWKTYGSPMFPFFNAIFRSPYYPPTNFADTRWLPQGVLEALVYPFLLATRMNREVSLRFRDGRYAVLVLLGLGVLLRLAWRAAPWRRSDRTTPPSAVPGDRTAAPAVARSGISEACGAERFLLAFFTVAYVIWQCSFAVSRYAAALEANAPTVMIVLVRRLTLRRRYQSILVALCGVAFLGSMHQLDQDRIPWPARLIEVHAPTFDRPERVLVVVVHNAPWAFVLPFLQPEIRVLGLVSNFTKPKDQTLFQLEMRDIIARHPGEIYMLTDDGYLEGDRAVARDNYGLVPGDGDCLRIQTYLQGIPIRLCPVRKSTP